MTVRRRLLGAGVLAVAAIVAFKAPATLWPTPAPEEQVADLRALFPALARLQVTALDVTEGCELFIYARGAYATAPGTEACEMSMTILRSSRRRTTFRPNALSPAFASSRQPSPMKLRALYVSWKTRTPRA